MVVATDSVERMGGLDAAAFGFVQSLAAELSTGRIELPSFPEVAVRVRRALAADNTSVDQLVRIIGSEPALAARVLKMANSAALNRSGKPVTDLRAAITRLGQNMVRSAAVSFAMAQLRQGAAWAPLEPWLREVWQRSTRVATLAFALARHQARAVNADEAFLAGLLHGLGELYILTRAWQHPRLFAEEPALRAILREWHVNVARAILENWEFPPEMVEAVGVQEELGRQHSGPADLGDVMVVARLMESFTEHPAELELNLTGVPACAALQLDAASGVAVIREGAAELETLRAALQ